MVLLEDFLTPSAGKSDDVNLNLYMNSNPRSFFKNLLDLNDTTLYKVNRLSESDQTMLAETITFQQLDKAVFVIEKSHEELIVDLKMTQGDISKFKFFHVLERMIKDVTLCSHNDEVIKANQMLMDLKDHKSVYTAAFRKNDILKKSIYYSTAMSIVYTVIKEHAKCVDFTDSLNEDKLIMLDNCKYVPSDKQNIQILDKTQQILHKASTDSLVSTTKSRNNMHTLTEGISDWFSAASAAKDAVTDPTNFISKSTNAIIDTTKDRIGQAADAMANSELMQFASNVTVGIGSIALAITGFLSIQMLLRSVAVKPLIHYLRTYEHILLVVDSGHTRGDRNIGRFVRVLMKIKEFLSAYMKNKNSKNIREYMKDLEKDRQTIERHNNDNSFGSDKLMKSYTHETGAYL